MIGFFLKDEISFFQSFSNEPEFVDKNSSNDKNEKPILSPPETTAVRKPALESQSITRVALT